jgi:hypothetical protein
LVEWGVAKQLQYRIIHRFEKLQLLNDIENKKKKFKVFRKNKINQSLFLLYISMDYCPEEIFFLAFYFYS